MPVAQARKFLQVDPGYSLMGMDHGSDHLRLLRETAQFRC